MRQRNEFKTSIKGNNATVFNTEHLSIKVSSRSKGKTAYPHGAIGSDLPLRNYVRYLVERYNRFKQADASFGRSEGRLSYAVIFKNVEAKFKAPTYFIPVERFGDLVDYLHGRIDQTILGKRNVARGQRNYETFDEFRSTHLQAADASE